MSATNLAIRNRPEVDAPRVAIAAPGTLGASVAMRPRARVAATKLERSGSGDTCQRTQQHGSDAGIEKWCDAGERPGPSSAAEPAHPKPTKRPKKARLRGPKCAQCKHVHGNRDKTGKKDTCWQCGCFVFKWPAPLPRKRAKLRRSKRKVDAAYLAYVRTLPCCAPHTWATAHDLGFPSDPHHTKSRGAGGSDRDTIPLWRGCHRDVEAFAGAFRGWNKAQLREWYAAQVEATQVAYRVRELMREAAELLVEGEKLEREAHRSRQELDALTGGLPS